MSFTLFVVVVGGGVGVGDDVVVGGGVGVDDVVGGGGGVDDVGGGGASDQLWLSKAGEKWNFKQTEFTSSATKDMLRKLTGLEVNTGGVIIMKKGLPIDVQELNRTAVSQLQESLWHIHSAGVVHTDIRISNVMKFDDRVELIDFGFAQSINGPGTQPSSESDPLSSRLGQLTIEDRLTAGQFASVATPGSGARKDEVGYRLAHYMNTTPNPITVKWTFQDDVEMLLNLILKCLAN